MSVRCRFLSLYVDRIQYANICDDSSDYNPFASIEIKRGKVILTKGYPMTQLYEYMSTRGITEHFLT